MDGYTQGSSGLAEIWKLVHGWTWEREPFITCVVILRYCTTISVLFSLYEDPNMSLITLSVKKFATDGETNTLPDNLTIASATAAKTYSCLLQDCCRLAVLTILEYIWDDITI